MKVSREYPQRAEVPDCKLSSPGGAEGPITKETKSHGSRMLAPVIGAFAEMSSDVDALADVIASALAADHTQFIFHQRYGGGGRVKRAL